MNYLLYFFQIFLIQYTAANVFTVGGNNNIPNLNNGNIPTGANVANGFGNGVPFANRGVSGANIQSNLARAKTSLNANKNLAQEVVDVSVQSSNNAADVVEIANDIANIDNSNANTNAACSNNGNEAGIPKFANIVEPPRKYGIDFYSDALEVQGGVKVKGKMPFNAKVEVKGALPTQGNGAVTYSFDKTSKNGN